MTLEHKIKHLQNIKTKFAEIFCKWLLDNKIDDKASNVFAPFLEISADHALENKESLNIQDVGVFAYIDSAYPVLEFGDNGLPIDNRWQSCIRAVSNFAKQNPATLSAEHRLIHEVTAIISCLNSAINVLNKIQSAGSNEQDAIEMLIATADMYEQQALASIEKIEQELYAKIQGSTILIDFQMAIEPEYDFADLTKYESDDVDDFANGLANYKPVDENEIRRLSPTSVDLACSNLFGGEVQQQIKDGFQINYREFAENDESVLVFDCVSVDAGSLTYQDLEVMLACGKERIDSQQKVKLCIIPIAAANIAEHFITLAIEYSNNEYKAYLIDSKVNTIASFVNSPIATIIEQTLKNVFGHSIAFNKLFLGHQSLFDTKSCGYFTIKVVDALIKTKSVSQQMFPSADAYFGSASNFLTAADVLNINQSIAKGGSLRSTPVVAAPADEAPSVASVSAPKIPKTRSIKPKRGIKIPLIKSKLPVVKRQTKEVNRNKVRKLLADDTREVRQAEPAVTNSSSSTSFLGTILYPFTFLANFATYILNGIKSAVRYLCCMRNNDVVGVIHAGNSTANVANSATASILEQNADSGTKNMLSALCLHRAKYRGSTATKTITTDSSESSHRKSIKRVLCFE